MAELSEEPRVDLSRILPRVQACFLGLRLGANGAPIDLSSDGRGNRRMAEEAVHIASVAGISVLKNGGVNVEELAAEFHRAFLGGGARTTEGGGFSGKALVLPPAPSSRQVVMLTPGALMLAMVPFSVFISIYARKQGVRFPLEQLVTKDMRAIADVGSVSDWLAAVTASSAVNKLVFRLSSYAVKEETFHGIRGILDVIPFRASVSGIPLAAGEAARLVRVAGDVFHPDVLYREDLGACAKILESLPDAWRSLCAALVAFARNPSDLDRAVKESVEFGWDPVVSGALAGAFVGANLGWHGIPLEYRVTTESFFLAVGLCRTALGTDDSK